MQKIIMSDEEARCQIMWSKLQSTVRVKLTSNNNNNKKKDEENYREV